MGRTSEDCAQLGLEARSRGRLSSNVNGTTVCVSHVSGITGARHVIEGNIEYVVLLANLRLDLEYRIDSYCHVLGHCCRSKNEHRSGCESKLQRFRHCVSPDNRRARGLVSLSKSAAADPTESLEMKTGQQCHRDKDECCCRQEKIG
jgi:hypothetical protein